jgi:hypothetical protein
MVPRRRLWRRSLIFTCRAASLPYGQGVQYGGLAIEVNLYLVGIESDGQGKLHLLVVDVEAFL